MAGILFNWLLVAIYLLPVNRYFDLYTGNAALHPFFVSVTEIEQNTKDKTLEISCKIFTDDFEKTLRQNCKCFADLLHPKNKTATDKLVTDYIKKHLQIEVDGKKMELHFIGYEQEEEAVRIYFQVDNVETVQHIEITDNLLFDYKKEEINMLHVTVKGTRKSRELTNPEDKVQFSF
ncbi:MAG: hypothetical protein H0W12_12575 [Chitinophagaceae bacterium]|nr:hypothetical protein [Chitinophagaceae bacterium]